MKEDEDTKTKDDRDNHALLIDSRQNRGLGCTNATKYVLDCCLKRLDSFTARGEH